MAERLKGALFSGAAAAIGKEYGCIVKPVFNKNGVEHPVIVEELRTGITPKPANPRAVVMHQL